MINKAINPTLCTTRLFAGLTSLFLTLFHGTTAAQSAFQSGYIVTATNDTLHGQIRWLSGLYSDTSVLFRSKTNTNETKEYRLSSLHSFRLNNGTSYVIAAISPVYPTYSYKDERAKADTGTAVKVALRLLIQGNKISLYAYEPDGNGPSYFYHDPTLPGQYMQLINWFFYWLPDGGITEHPTPTEWQNICEAGYQDDPVIFQGYKKQLEKYANTEDLRHLLNNTSCTEKQLINIARAINGQGNFQQAPPRSSSVRYPNSICFILSPTISSFYYDDNYTPDNGYSSLSFVPILGVGYEYGIFPDWLFCAGRTSFLYSQFSTRLPAYLYSVYLSARNTSFTQSIFMHRLPMGKRFGMRLGLDLSYNTSYFTTTNISPKSDSLDRQFPRRFNECQLTFGIKVSAQYQNFDLSVSLPTITRTWTRHINGYYLSPRFLGITLAYHAFTKNGGLK